MSKQITVDQSEVQRVITEIVEDVSILAISATNFRSEIELAAERSDATFLKNISKSMASAETATKQVKNTFLEIQESLEAYLREFQEFNEDSGRF